MLLKNKKVAIIGAGPVGLTLAKLLQQNGVTVNVYERDKDETARIQGGTLDLDITLGQLALEKAGLLDEFYKIARPTGERAADIYGTIIMDEFPDKDSLLNRPEIDRNDLRKLLLNSLTPRTVIWNKKFSSLENNRGENWLHFEGGAIETADIIIGANGAMCNLRQYLTDSVPKYTGTVIIQGEILNPEKDCPNFKKICGTGNLMVMGEQKMLFSQTKANGALHYYLSFLKPENWLFEHNLNFKNKKTIIPFIEELFSNWSKDYKELFLATEDFTLLPMKNMPLNKKWETKNNITLIGDAAHVMPPFAGIGVNIGLLDALYLSDNLTNGQFSDIATAIQDYELKMFDYASKAQEDTKEAESGIHSVKDTEDIIKDRR